MAEVNEKDFICETSVDSVERKTSKCDTFLKVPSVPSEEEPIPSDPTPSTSLPPIPTITPSLCIDNQYFANYINEKPKMDDVDYLSRAFSSNIEQQNSKISEALGCLAVCNQITEKYQCTLDNSFQILVDDFSEKAFRLSSLTSQLHALRQTHHANLQVRKNEESQLEEIAWRIEREEKRIKKLDGKLWKFYENREGNRKGAKEKTQEDEEENR
ncbi:hypothetical protein CRE_21608 [Caenorhabditis remanei]|uniref:Uncharacterized protein n=1 Tax=Caenorhabditis remanei TaxID=31234 RepID=E3NM98_CAERE|nr:hypothetical protein CRE_21608 [Caenorhabditis remanei]